MYRTMDKKRQRQLALATAVLLMAFSSPVCPVAVAALSAESEHLTPQGGRSMSFAIKTPAFSEGGAIPKQYSCDGADLSPGLTWANAPAGTKSFALIADDPDAPAGTWTHWILWNVPANATALPEGVPKEPTLGDGTHQGKNDFKRVGYAGPCPSPGKAHRYFFTLYALDDKLEIQAGANRNELERAMKEHVLSEAKLMGRYQR